MRKGGYNGGKLAREAIGEQQQHLQPIAGSSEAYIEVWKSVVEDFGPKHFRESDRETLDSYCCLVLALRDVRAQVKADGPIIVTTKGEKKENPALALMNTLSRTLLAHARALKITPSARLEHSQIPKDSEHRRKEQERVEKAAQPDTGLSLVM